MTLAHRTRRTRRTAGSLQSVLRTLATETSDVVAEGPTLPGEVLLAGAVLRQALLDARIQAPLKKADAQRKRLGEQAQARAFLQDSQEGLSFWCYVVGADPEAIQAALLRAAGATTHDRRA